jgi:hypothetical protein
VGAEESGVVPQALL